MNTGKIVTMSLLLSPNRLAKKDLEICESLSPLEILPAEGSSLSRFQSNIASADAEQRRVEEEGEGDENANASTALLCPERTT